MTVYRHSIRGHTVTEVDARNILPQRPYRWRNTPGWDPAKTPVSIPEDPDLARRCPTCGAGIGQRCVTAGGRKFTTGEKPHIARNMEAAS